MYDGDTGLAITDWSNNSPANFRSYTLPPPSAPDPGLSDDTKAMLAKMKVGTGPDNWAIYAYWSADLKDYLERTLAERFLADGTRTAASRGWCNAPTGETRFAVTTDNMLRDSIMLCPPAFTAAAEQFETVSDCQNSPNAAAAGNYLHQTSPRSLSLLHELFHLTMGHAKTPDTGSKLSFSVSNLFLLPVNSLIFHEDHMLTATDSNTCDS
jgi:hypothetical protein